MVTPKRDKGQTVCAVAPELVEGRVWSIWADVRLAFEGGQDIRSDTEATKQPAIHEVAMDGHKAVT